MKKIQYITPDMEMAAVLCPGHLCQASYEVVTEVFEDPEEIIVNNWDE